MVVFGLTINTLAVIGNNLGYFISLKRQTQWDKSMLAFPIKRDVRDAFTFDQSQCARNVVDAHPG